MNTVLVRYSNYVRTKRYEKKNPNAKQAVKAEISMKTKSFNDLAKHSSISRGCLKSSELILLSFASVYGAASSIQNSVSPLVLRLHKVQER